MQPLNSKIVVLNNVVNFLLMLTTKITNSRLVEYAVSYGERHTRLGVLHHKIHFGKRKEVFFWTV